MSNDQRIQSGIRALVQSAGVPAVPLEQIRERMPHLTFAQKRREHRSAVAAAVAAAAIISAIPLVSPAVMQNLEARYRAAVQALGGIAPPPAPQGLVAELQARSATLTLKQAQARVRFQITPPAGLPNDVVSSKIIVTPLGIYSKATRSWSVGPNEVRFWYRRANGHEFTIAADRYDPHAEPLGKYIFEDGSPTAQGKPVLIEHERFAWRNGDQIMNAIDGPELSNREIRSIQSAMHGTPLPLRPLHSADTSPTHTLHVFVKP